jgi:hypothetical protein
MADKSLLMTFLNELGEKASITVPAVREDLTEAEVSAAMDSIITGNVFTTSGGDLKIKHSAQVTERTVTALDVR